MRDGYDQVTNRGSIDPGVALSVHMYMYLQHAHAHATCHKNTNETKATLIVNGVTCTETGDSVGSHATDSVREGRRGIRRDGECTSDGAAHVHHTLLGGAAWARRRLRCRLGGGHLSWAGLERRRGRQRRRRRVGRSLGWLEERVGGHIRLCRWWVDAQIKRQTNEAIVAF